MSKKTEKTDTTDAMADTKQVVAQLFQEFQREEQGNKVTSNNMFSLLTKIGMAIDGGITLTKPKE